MRKQHEQQSNTTTGAAIHSISPPEQAGNAQEQVNEQNSLRLTLPGPGEQVTLQVSQGALLLDFDVSTALFVRTGNDLTLESVDGGKIILGGYFAVNGGVILPPFILPDGTIVPAAGFLRAQAPELDISTATGNAPNNRTYTPSYEANELLEGVDRLGSLGTDVWGQGATIKLANTKAAASQLQMQNSSSLPTPSTPDSQRIDDDTITISSSGHISNISIFGDSLEGEPLGTRLSHDNTPGDDTLSLALPDGYNEQSYIAGGNIGGKQVYGNDSITVNALSLSNAKVDGGRGNDTIILNTEVFQSLVGGDTIEDMSGSARGGNDTIAVTTLKGGVVGGDAGLDMYDAARGGNDSISVENASNGSRLAGDAGGNMSDSAQGGNDTINVVNWSSNGYLGGDAGGDMSGSAKGGNDSINVAKWGSGGILGGDAAHFMFDYAQGGNDTINIGRMEWGYLGGDAGSWLHGHAQGGNDSITVRDMTTGYVTGDAGGYLYEFAQGGNDTLSVMNMTAGGLGGDAGVSLFGSAQGGADSINVENLSGGYIGGDVAYEMFESARGGNDTINVKNMTGGKIGGDTGVIMNDFAQGGNDYISVDNLSGGSLGGDVGGTLFGNAIGGNDTINVRNMTGGYLGGDAGDGMTNSQVALKTKQSGNDSITVEYMGGGSLGGDAGFRMDADTTGGNDSIAVGTMDGGCIGGDAGTDIWGSNVQGGNDSISVTTLNGGSVSGDATTIGVDYLLASNVTGGDDTIGVTTMAGGAIYGDAGTVFGSITAGNDSMYVGTMSGGSIYGDTGSGHGAGNDTITINSLEGSAAKTIDGGGGNDLFTYNNDAGHTLTLDEAGHVSIDGNANYANTTITGFEGLGGGSGNDTLIGNSGKNILVGGAGHDVLTGGLGADTFVWKLGHQGTEDAPVTDVVTDFNFSEGDKLDLSQLLDDGARDHLDDYLNILHDGNNIVLQISTQGHMGAGRFDQSIVLENTSLTDDQLMQQLILQISS